MQMQHMLDFNDGIAKVQKSAGRIRVELQARVEQSGEQSIKGNSKGVVKHQAKG